MQAVLSILEEHLPLDLARLVLSYNTLDFPEFQITFIATHLGHFTIRHGRETFQTVLHSAVLRSPFLFHFVFEGSWFYSSVTDEAADLSPEQSNQIRHFLFANASQSQILEILRTGGTFLTAFV